MAGDVLGKAPGLLHKVHFGLLIEVGASGMRTAAFHACHYRLKFFTLRQLLIKMFWASPMTSLIFSACFAAQHMVSETVEFLY